MTTTINDITDLIRILEQQPQWANALRSILLSPELLELPEKFAEFVAATNDNFRTVNRRLEALETGQAELIAGQAELKADVEELKTGQAELRGGQAELKADVEELKTGQAELRGGQAELKADVEELKTGQAELRGGQAELKADVEELKTGQAELRGGQAELKADVEELKSGYSELRADVKELKTGYSELSADVKELKTGYSELSADVKELKTGYSELRADVKELKTGYERLERRVTRMDGDVRSLKGTDYEGFAARLARRLLRRNLNIINADLLSSRYDFSQAASLARAASSSGLITYEESEELEIADLILLGQDEDGQPVYIAAEVSITIHADDIERAEVRADILARATGVRAVAAVIGTDVALGLPTGQVSVMLLPERDEPIQD